MLNETDKLVIRLSSYIAALEHNYAQLKEVHDETLKALRDLEKPIPHVDTPSEA